MTPARKPGQPLAGAAAPARVALGLAGNTASRSVPIARVHVMEDFNPRSTWDRAAFTPEALAPLVQSIREKGVLQPILVRPKQGSAGEYELVAGERRLRAADLAGLTDVPAVVKQAGDDEAFELALIENGQRENPSYVAETLAGFRYLSTLTQRPVEDVVVLLNQLRNRTAEDTFGVRDALVRLFGSRGASYASWSLVRAKLLKMTPEELTAVHQRKLPPLVAVELVSLPEGHPERARLLRMAIDHEFSAQQLREHVRLALRAAGDVNDLTVRAARVRRQLGRVGRLQGPDGERAASLLTELEELLQRAGKRGARRASGR